MLSVAVESKNFYINHLNPGDRLINFKRSEATLNEKEKGGSVKTKAPLSVTPEAEKRAVIVSPHINAHDISMISFRKRSEPSKRGFLISGGNWFNTKQLSLRKRANEDKKEDKLTKRGFLITGGNWFNTKQLSLRKRAKRGFTITGGNHYGTTRNGRPFTPKFLQRRPQQARPFWKDDRAIYSGSFDTSKLDINRIIQDFWNS